LPQTLRDTIIVARRLGINYLWVDTFCIIQDGDNKQDWKAEAPK